MTNVVAVGPFRLVNPTAEQEATARDAIAAIRFPWDRLAPALASRGGAIQVEWTELDTGTAGLSYSASLRILLDQDRDVATQGFTLAHEVGHLVDSVSLTNQARTDLIALLHEQSGPIGHDACRDVSRWHSDMNDYYWRMREAYADTFVGAFAPSLWDGGWRFVHYTADLAEARRITLQTIPEPEAPALEPTPSPTPEPEPAPEDTVVTYLPRSAWGAAPRSSHPGSLSADDVVGLAFHWPAMAQPKTTREQVARALRAWQRYHMGTHGWSDIAYQIAVDQAGRAWYLRGLGQRSAANGGTTVNGAFGAVLLVLAPGEEPTPEMVATVRGVVADHRRLFPNSTRLVGHGEIRPGGWTECPGPAVRAHLARGTFEPNQEDDDMPTPEDVAQAVWNQNLPTPGSSDPMRAKWLLSQAHNRAGLALDALGALAEDVAQLAAMVKALPGAGPDTAQLADEIAQRTAAKVAEVHAAVSAADVAAQLEVTVKE